MNIFQHLIKDESIIGIGPLMIERHPDQASQVLYGACKYFFKLHLIAHTDKIESDWFAPKTEEADIEKMKAWKADYFRIRNLVAERVGEEIV